jgi:hypothetical protein
MIPPKPSGSWIEEHFTADACTLTWRLPSSGMTNYLPVLLSTGVVVLIVVQGFVFAPWRGNPMQWLFMLVPLLVLFPVLKNFRRSRPESITLGPDYFRHDPGQAGGVWASVDAHRNHGMGAGPRAVEIPKGELGEIVIERVGGQLRLRYDVGADRVEIGRYLREPEKEWLAKVIREWQKATGTVKEVFAEGPEGVRTSAADRVARDAEPGAAADGGA